MGNKRNDDDNIFKSMNITTRDLYIIIMVIVLITMYPVFLFIWLFVLFLLIKIDRYFVEKDLNKSGNILLCFHFISLFLWCMTYNRKDLRQICLFFSIILNIISAAIFPSLRLEFLFLMFSHLGMDVLLTIYND